MRSKKSNIYNILCTYPIHTKEKFNTFKTKQQQISQRIIKNSQPICCVKKLPVVSPPGASVVDQASAAAEAVKLQSKKLNVSSQEEDTQKTNCGKVDSIFVPMIFCKFFFFFGPYVLFIFSQNVQDFFHSFPIVHNSSLSYEFPKFESKLGEVFQLGQSGRTQVGDQKFFKKVGRQIGGSGEGMTLSSPLGETAQQKKAVIRILPYDAVIDLAVTSKRSWSHN